jgi:hypothetical protein
VNAVGQTLIEFLLLTMIFVVLIAGIARKIPITFSRATPYLGGKVEQRLETGRGFALNSSGNDLWIKPTNPKGGMRDTGKQ